MNNPVASSSVRRPPRPLLGLRHTPGRLALAVFRVPLWAYRHDLGWLLGHTFLLLVHSGRRTGEPHAMVAMVLRYDPGTREAVICSAWGPRLAPRNLSQSPYGRCGRCESRHGGGQR